MVLQFLTLCCCFMGVFTINEKLQLVVERKVTNFGQDLVLFCKVKNCCTENAGWDSGPETIIIDVKRLVGKKFGVGRRYKSTYNSTGYSLVITNLTESDLNRTYTCVHGLDESNHTLLTKANAFIDKDDVKQPMAEEDEIVSTIVGVIGGITAVILVLIGIIVLYRKYKRREYLRVEQTTELQNLDIPVVFQTFPETDKKLYDDIMKSGTGTETRRFIRVMIVGKHGAGKTTLLRRLFGEPIDNVKSTDGVDIDIRSVKIRISDGEWIIDKDRNIKKELLARIKTAVHEDKIADTSRTGEGRTESWIKDFDGLTPQEIDRSQSKSQSKEQESTSAESTDKNIHSTAQAVSLDENTYPKATSDNTSQIQSTFGEANDETDPSKAENIVSYQRVDEILSQKITDAVNDYLRGIEELEIPSVPCAECGFWDFAGEKDYLATHQIFLNPNALYILVCDIMDEVTPLRADDFDSVGSRRNIR